MKKWISVLMIVIMMLGLLGEIPPTVKAADGPVDILQYESNTDATEYGVYDIAGMEKLAKLVNEQGINFDGKTIYLKNDLYYDKNIVNNYTPIGNFDARFSGNFNGNNHIISGINIFLDEVDDMRNAIGLFGCVLANHPIRFSNIILDDSIMSDRTEYTGEYTHSLGGIIGWTDDSSTTVDNISYIFLNDCIVTENVILKSSCKRCSVGGIIGSSEYCKISNCRNYGKIYSYENAGGISGTSWSRATIINCINYGNIYSENNIDATYSSEIGGITGYLGSSSVIQNSCNQGIVGNVDNNSHYIIGGIVGHLAGKMTNCYNSGKLFYNQQQKGCGGVFGEGIGIVVNCYSVGKINSNGYSTSLGSLGTIQDTKVPQDIRYGYCLKEVAKDIINTDNKSSNVEIPDYDLHEYLETEMKTLEFVTILNTNSKKEGYNEVWIMDVDKKYNNGFPIFKDVLYDELESEQELDSETQTSSGNAVAHLYHDYRYQTPVTDTDIRVYANGGTTTVDGIKTNYKVATVYTDILASYRYETNSKGAVKASTGKVIAGVTTSDSKPTVSKNKITDTSGAQMATAKVANGVVTITAKKTAGTAYLWVIDTGDAGVSTCCKITVKAAPTKVTLHQSSTATEKYAKADIAVSELTTVYVKGTGGDGTYTATVAKAAADYFDVTKVAANQFRITAKGLKNNKATTGKITFQCGENGKKAALTAKAVNPAKSVSISAASGVTVSGDSVEIATSETSATSGTLQAEATLASASYATTDTPKVYAMGSETGFSLTKGRFKVTGNPDSTQRKIKASLSKDKKTISVTVAKKTPSGTKAYFLLGYNENCYKVITVTAK